MFRAVRLAAITGTLMFSLIALGGCSDASESVGSGDDQPDGTATTPADGSTAAATGIPDPTVRSLQQALSDLGYLSGAVDGLLGDDTTEAIQSFQADQALDANGHIDLETLLSIEAASPEASTDVVQGLQTALAELGYYQDLIDGVAGPNTTAGVSAFQAATGLAATGVVDGPTFERLVLTYDEEVTQAHHAAIEETNHGGGVPASDGGIPEGADDGDYLQQGDTGPEVEAIQRRLLELGYRPGAPDGAFGAETASAVMAFQKHEGLERDSIVGPEVRGRLDAPQGAGPKSTEAGPRVEVDLDRQILFGIDSSGNATVINVSTGSGRQYQSAEAGKGIVTAHTPTGEFIVQRRVDGLREAPLGTLYRPLYFDGGWAIHGNPYVPGYPASHGCVRTANIDQDFVFDLLADGDPVWIYGNNPPTPEDASPGF